MPVRLNGSTSGYVELAAPAVAGTTSLELPTDSIKPGLVLVAAESFSAVSSVSVNNCFSATYDNYRVVTKFGGTVNPMTVSLRLRVSGADNTAAQYTVRASYAGTASGTVSVAGATLWDISTASFENWQLALDFSAPAVAAPTIVTGSGMTGTPQYWTGLALHHSASTAFSGFTLATSAGTLSGVMSVYGYRNSL